MDPTGAELDRLPTYTEGYMVVDVPLATYQTPATLVGRNIERGVIGFTLAGLIVAAAGHYGRSRRGTAGASS
jgi:apolipoprotein N-acyltransferase